MAGDRRRTADPAPGLDQPGWPSVPCALGAICQLPSSVSAEFVAAAGFDFLVVDLQHGAIGFETGVTMMQACAGRTTVLVRVPTGSHAVIGRVLDAGADGILVPDIGSAGQAAAAVAASRWPPAGTRSLGRTALASLRSRNAPICLAMIESQTAVERVDEIAATPGLDGLFIGPVDLSLSLKGYVGDVLDGGALERALERVAGSATRAGLPLGVHTGDPATLVRMWELGASFATVAVDAGLLIGGARARLSAAAQTRRAASASEG